MPSLLDSIKQHEGFRSKPYNCSNGFLTVGYGAAIKDLEIDENIAEQILVSQILKLEKRVSETFDWYDGCPDTIKDVIVEMCFQIGVSGFSKFKKTIVYASSYDWINMSVEMLDSKWAKSDSPNRAKALSDRVAGVIDD